MAVYIFRAKGAQARRLASVRLLGEAPGNAKYCEHINYFQAYMPHSRNSGIVTLVGGDANAQMGAASNMEALHNHQCMSSSHLEHRRGRCQQLLNARARIGSMAPSTWHCPGPIHVGQSGHWRCIDYLLSNQQGALESSCHAWQLVQHVRDSDRVLLSCIPLAQKACQVVEKTAKLMATRGCIEMDRSAQAKLSGQRRHQ